MITLNIIILQANAIAGKTKLTEGGCKEIVRRWEERKPEDPVLVFIGQVGTSLPAGKIIRLYYVEEEKVVKAEIQLFMNFSGMIQVLQKIETRELSNLIDAELKAISIIPDIGEDNGQSK